MMSRAPMICLLSASLVVLAVGCGSRTNSNSQAGAAGPAPTVTGTDNQVNGVAANREIGVVFSEAMAPATINSYTFLIKGVTGSVSYDAPSRIATFKPDHDLATGTPYTATITTGVVSAGGVHMAKDYTFSFTTRATEDTSPPKVMSITPTDGATCVGQGVKVAAIFSEGLDPATINNSSFQIGGVQGTVTYDPVNLTATFTPSSPLAESTTYTGTLTTAIADLADVPLASAVTFSFTTGPCGPNGAGATFLYVEGNSASTPGTENHAVIHGYSASVNDAALTPVPGSPFSLQGTPGSVIAVNNTVYASSTDVSSTSAPTGSSTITFLRADGASGTLKQFGTLSVPGTSTLGLAAGPSARYVYAVDDSGDILTLKVNLDGTLTNTGLETQGLKFGSEPVISPNGKLAYASVEQASFGEPSLTWALTRDAGSGALKPTQQVSGEDLDNLQFDTSGQYLLSEFDNQIKVYSVNYSTGALTPVSGTPYPVPLRGSGDITPGFHLGPSSKFAYTLSAGLNANLDREYLSVFSFAQSMGKLAPVQTFFDTARNGEPVSLIVDAALVFVVNTDNGPNRPSNISAFKRDVTTGMLSAGGPPVIVNSDLDSATVINFQ